MSNKTTSFPETDVSKLKKLFESENTPLYKLADSMGLSFDTLSRILQGKKVGPKVLHSIAKHFHLNVSDLLAKGSSNRALYSGSDSKDIVFLDKLTSLSELYKNPDYIDSRFFSDSKNLITHKHYYCNFKNEDDLQKIQNFLKAFTENAALNTGTNKTNQMSDVIEEMQYLRNQMHINKPIEELDSMNIGIYYGHYFYRAMEISDYTDRYNSDPYEEPSENVYTYIRPSGKRIEVLIFYQKEESLDLPEQIRIYPKTGYTEDDLIEEYRNAYDFVFDYLKRDTTLLDEYIEFHMKRQWLLVKDAPEMDEVQNNPISGFLHPNYFIYSTPNKIITQSDFESNKTYESYLQRQKRFQEVCEKHLKFKYSLHIPKYDGIIDEAAVYGKKLYERLDNEKQLVVKVEKEKK